MKSALSNKSVIEKVIGPKYFKENKTVLINSDSFFKLSEEIF